MGNAANQIYEEVLGDYTKNQYMRPLRTLRYTLPATAATYTLVPLPFAGEIVDVVVRSLDTTASTVTVNVAGNPAAVTTKSTTNHNLARATSIDDSYSAFTDGQAIAIVNSGNAASTVDIIIAVTQSN